MSSGPSGAASQPFLMSRAEYRAWAMRQPRGRFERVDGRVFATSPERLGHALIKGRAWQALDRAILFAGLNCTAFPDGATVEIDEGTDYEPDVVVSCGADFAMTDIVAPRPLIVVEISSPSSRGVDNGSKLADYFRVASIAHYLIVSARRTEIVHHRRRDDRIETRVLTKGPVKLDPPGIVFAVEDVYARLTLG